MKTTVKGFIAVHVWDWVDGDDKYRFNWWTEDSKENISSDGIYTIIGDYDIEIEAPDNLDELIRANKLTALQKKRKLTLAENEQRINEIDRQIGELLAIEYKEE